MAIPIPPISDWVIRPFNQEPYPTIDEIREDSLFFEGIRGITRVNNTVQLVEPVNYINLDIVINKDDAILGQEKEHVQTVNITPSGAIIESARHRVPELAKASLDKYSLNRMKDLKLVTKAFKTKFPFYRPDLQRKSYNKIFEVIKKAITRNIPYVQDAAIPFMEIPLSNTGGGTVNFRIGPYPTSAAAKIETRYVRYISYLIRRYALPLLISGRVVRYVKPVEGATGRYGAAYQNKEEEYKNTYEVMEIKVSLSTAMGEHGYFILFYLEQIIKAVETLHRKAHYAPTTFRAPITANVGNR